MKKIFSFFAAVLFAGSMMMATEATMQYTGSSTTNMSATDNNAALVGLDADLFEVLSAKCSASAEVGLNKDGTIRLYCDKNNGNGTKMTVSVIGTINSIKLDIAQEADFEVKANGSKVEAADGAYAIAAASFTIQNVKTGENVQLWFKKITIDYTAVVPDVAKPAIAGNAQFLETTEVSIICATEGAKIYYTLDGSEPDANATLYDKAFKLDASATVKAIAIKDASKSAIAEKEFTKVVPMTVAEANTALESRTFIADQYVSGIVSQVDSYNENYGSIIYWISDDGTTADQLEVYGGLGLNGAKFASQNDLAVGDMVVVFGSLKVFTSGENKIKEFDKNNYLLKLEKAEPTAVENTAVEMKATKIVRDGQLYILRDGQLFTATGAAVK